MRKREIERGKRAMSTALIPAQSAEIQTRAVAVALRSLWGGSISLLLYTLLSTDLTTV